MSSHCPADVGIIGKLMVVSPSLAASLPRPTTNIHRGLQSSFMERSRRDVVEGEVEGVGDWFKV